MKTLIVAASKHGCTVRCAKRLGGYLQGEVEIKELKTAVHTRDIDIEAFDTVIVGASVYMGKVSKEVSAFMNQHMKELQKKKTGVFLCCLQTGEQAQGQLENNFSQEFLNTVSVKKVFGGEIIQKDMNFFERIIIKMIMKTNQDIYAVLDGNIQEFADCIKN
jgi:menaquinone-dependent protoporphyrinogen oxidase